MTAHSIGPYCTGAGAPAGASPLLWRPQRQRRVMTWCSVTCTVIGGMSKTCRREQPTSGAAVRSLPHPLQHAGSCRITTSGWATSSSVLPRWPCCPPGLRLDFPRCDFGAGFAGPSDDGGFDEFREFARTCASNCATRAFKASFSSRNNFNSARIATTSSANSA